MPLNGTLTVRIDDGHTDRHVTTFVRSLKFTKVAPGGHQSIQCSVVLPRDTFRDLGPEDRIYVYDTRTGNTVIDGYLKNPTPVDGPQGQSFDLSALGGMWRASDRVRSLVYVARDLDQFEKTVDSSDAADIETGDWANDTRFQRVRTSFPGGSVLGTGASAAAGNYQLDRAQFGLGAVRIGEYNSGMDSGDFAVEFIHTTGVSSSQPMAAGGRNFLLFSGTDFPSDTRRFALRQRRTGGATTVGNDATWTDFVDFSMVGQRMDRAGALLTGATNYGNADGVLASQVVEDLLGRMIPGADQATARVDPTTFKITQLTYDQARAADVLNDLLNWESDYTWGLYETLPSGLHRFDFRTWGTDPRYVFSTADGWTEEGADVDLCSQITVFWSDADGNTQQVTVTADDLLAEGLITPAQIANLNGRERDADSLTLPSGKGSADNAAQYGRAELLEKINPSRAGSLTVTRPVLDLYTGNMAMPWELEPGYPGVVRELGYQLRITQADYDDANTSMVLRLGAPAETDDQLLARLSTGT